MELAVECFMNRSTYPAAISSRYSPIKASLSGAMPATRSSSGFSKKRVSISRRIPRLNSLGFSSALRGQKGMR